MMRNRKTGISNHPLNFMCLQKPRVCSPNLVYESKIILPFRHFIITSQDSEERRWVNASKLLSPLSTNVCMTQSKMQKEQRKWKQNFQYACIVTTPAHFVVKYIFTCRSSDANNNYLLLHRGDEGVTLTGAPCIPTSPGLPGNPG